MRRGIVAGVALALPAAAFMFIAVVAHDRASEASEPPAIGTAPPATHPVTPLLSLRRTPDALADQVREANFLAAMQPVTEAVQDQSCVSVAVDGTVIVDDNATTSFIPASNAKLLTAAVALDVLGPDYKFTTEARGSMGFDGVIPRLVLVGGGDPLLSSDEYPGSGINTYAPFNTTRLENLADALKNAGATTVQNLVSDESRYDTVRDAPGWGDAIEGMDASNLSALMVNDGFTKLSSRERNESSSVGARQVFQGMLERRGVDVLLSAEGTADGEPVLASVQSVPLSAILEEMLTTSDNVTAELLLKEVGLVVTGVGSTAAGTSVVADRLASWDVPTEGLELHDGSGLSVDDRVSCATLLGVLEHVGGSGPIYDGLPVAGESGTLAGYFNGTSANGVLRAKTGTLSVARSLSGYYPSSDGSMLAFSFLVNGENAKSRAERLWDDLARALASYPQGPSADQLAPLLPESP